MIIIIITSTYTIITTPNTTTPATTTITTITINAITTTTTMITTTTVVLILEIHSQKEIPFILTYIHISSLELLQREQGECQYQPMDTTQAIRTSGI